MNMTTIRKEDHREREPNSMGPTYWLTTMMCDRQGPVR